MLQLTVADVCTATGGTLACGGEETVFTSVAIDSRAVSPGALFVPLPGARTDGHHYIGAAVERGAAGFLFAARRTFAFPAGATGIAVRDPLAALQMLAAWHRNRLRAQVVGIAGSNGKTTTKELLAQMCATTKRTLATLGNQNNHIGLPLTLLRADDQVEVLVLELGTSGAGELAFLSSLARPHVGVITTVAEEHTETLHDLAGVIAAETELIAALPADGIAIVHGDDEALLEAVRHLARCRVVTFGHEQRHPYRVADIEVSRQGTSCTVLTPVGGCRVRLPLLGSHFALAALAALAVAVECGVALEEACAALAMARGAPHRMTVVEVPARRLTVLDDCYNANPASMRQALLTATQVRHEGERFIAVLGDMLELGALSDCRHREIGEYIAALAPPPDLVITIGEDIRRAAARLKQVGIEVQSFATAEAAAPFVRAQIRTYAGPQLLLLKGSRGVHLEEVLCHLTA